jgi:hypothetical protein
VLEYRGAETINEEANPVAWALMLAELDEAQKPLAESGLQGHAYAKQQEQSRQPLR